MKRKLLLASAMAMSLGSLASCSFIFNYVIPSYPGDNGGIGEDTGVEDAGTYNIRIWCDERIVNLTKTQVGNFVNQAKDENGNQKYKINLSIDPAGEDKTAASMLEDVQSGADIYVFAQDQLAKLQKGGALAPISGAMEAAVKRETEQVGIDAATINNKLYAFPFTSDNGYYLMYDKSIIPDDKVQNIEDIVSICEQRKMIFNYPVFANGFYSASYFMSKGLDCESIWEIDASNKFSGYIDTYNTDKGFIAAKGIRQLRAHSTVFGNDDLPGKFGNGLAACVTGSWNYPVAEKLLGNNLGCAPMPYFTVDGQRYHISSFSGYKLIGVKPQTDPKKVSVCKRIARYLSNQVCQLERFAAVNWGPSNIADLQNPVVMSSPGLKALREQQEYSKPQRQCPSSWFSTLSSMVGSIEATSSDSDLRAALKLYELNLETMIGD